MLTTRISPLAVNRVLGLAEDIEAALASDPAARALPGTVILGTGGAALLRTGDPGPRVIAPLACALRPGALGRAQIARCDGVVASDAEEARVVATAIRAGALLVVAVDAGAAGTTFLAGADPADVNAAWDTIDHHPDLRAALEGAGRMRTAQATEAVLIARGIVEALVACAWGNGGATTHGERG